MFSAARELGLGAAPAAKTKDFDHRIGQVEARGNLPRNRFEIEKFTFDVLHRLAPGTNQVMMSFQISIHAQRGRVRRDLAQKAALDEKTKIVVNRSQRNGRNSLLDRCVNMFRRMVPVRSDDRFVNNLTLVRGGKAALPGEFTKLLVGEPHDYRIGLMIY